MDISEQTTKRWTIDAALLATGFVLAALTMWWATLRGAGLGADTSAYIRTATNIAEGRHWAPGGIAADHWPPGYPLLLAITGTLTGGDYLIAARVVAIALYGASAILSSILVYQIAGKRWLAALGWLFYVVSPWNLRVQAWAYSEASAVASSLAALVCWGMYLKLNMRSWLVATALAAAASTMARYSNLAVTGAICLSALLLHGSWRSRVRRTLALGLPTAGTLAAWFLYCSRLESNVTSRALVWHPVSYSSIKAVIFVLYDYTFGLASSYKMQAYVILACLCLGMLALWLSWRQGSASDSDGGLILAITMFFFFVVYMAILFATMSFVDASTPMNHRLLTPAFIVMFCGVIGLVGISTAPLRHPLGNLVCATIVGCACVFGLLRWHPELSEVRREGLGFASRTFQESEILAHLVSIKPNVPVHANDPQAVMFVTGLPARTAPPQKNDFTGDINDDYGEQVAELMESCRDGSAVAVYISELRSGYLDIEWIEANIPDSPILYQTDEGRIYGKR